MTENNLNNTDVSQTPTWFERKYELTSLTEHGLALSVWLRGTHARLKEILHDRSRNAEHNDHHLAPDYPGFRVCHFTSQSSSWAGTENPPLFLVERICSWLRRHTDRRMPLDCMSGGAYA